MSYTIKNVLLIIKKIKLIRKKKFVIVTFNLKYKAFVIYVTTLNISFDIDDEVHRSKKT